MVKGLETDEKQEVSTAQKPKKFVYSTEYFEKRRLL